MSNVIKWNSLPAIEQETLNFPNTEWVRASDHERIVAEHVLAIKKTDERWRESTDQLLTEIVELRAEIVRQQRAMTTGDRNWHQLNKTIAKQKRVIEKLREQRDIELEDNCWDDALTGGRPFEQARAMMDAEIEAIEKEEA